MPAKVSSSPFSTELLITKITAPVHRSKIVRRSRLIDLFQAGMQRKLTWIVAPAGYGKTTLLCEWMITTKAIGWPVAWVSLDSADDGLLRFWSYVIGALKTIKPDLHQDLPGFIGAAGIKPDGSQLTPLINQIAEIPHHFSLVLDDFHEIKSENIFKTLAYLLDHMPDRMHLVIASRTATRLPISRLRVRDQLVTISYSDLAFTVDETRTFMDEVMGVATDAEDIQTLNKLTEGWIAGLQLAGLSLSGGRDVKDFLTGFAGSNRYIVDYLTDEMLSQLDEPIKEFLIRSSIFDQFCAPLCDYVPGIQNSQEIIERLEHSNVLIVPIDNWPGWYRYHRLFADALGIYLEKSYLAQVPAMHLAACEWLEKQGYPELAIPHALAAGEHEKAADIVEACAFNAIVESRMVSVMQWMDRLPLHIYRNRPQFGIYYCIASFPLGHVAEVERHLANLEEMIAQNIRPPEEMESLTRQAHALRATLTCIQGDYERGIDLGNQAFGELTEKDIFFRGLIKYYLHYAYLAEGKFAEAVEAIEYAMHNAKKQQLAREHIYLGSVFGLARVYKHLGRLQEAVQLFEYALNYTLNRKLDLELTRIAQCGLADIYYEWNQFQFAEEQMEIAQEYFTRYGSSYMEWYYSPDLLFLFARNTYIHKDYKRTEEILRSLLYKNQELFPIPFAFETITSLLVRTWLAARNQNEINKWKESIQQMRKIDPGKVTVTETAEMIRVMLYLEKVQACVPLLDDLESRSSASDPLDLQIERLIIQALAWQTLGEKRRAREALSRALQLAEPGGYIRIFIDEGRVMKEMLSDLLALEKERDRKSGDPLSPIAYIETLLSNFEMIAREKSKKPASSNVYTPLAEPLSSKELEILKLLAAGRYPQEIARDLVISINTIHTHIKHIYKKLEVHNREEAIEKAIAFDLV